MNRKTITVFICLILLITVGVGIYYAVSSKKNGQTVTAVVKDFVRFSDAEGYVIKNETTVDLSGGSFMRFYYKNGERVAGNAKIASIYSTETDGTLINEIETLDSKIKNMSNEYVNLTANDVLKVEKYIDEDIDKIQTVMLTGDAAQCALISDRLYALFNIKHTNQSPKEEDKEALLAEKTALENKLSSDKRDVFAPCGGIFAEKTDGFEGLADVSLALGMTVEQFDELSEKKAQSAERQCKIVDNYKWYIACKVKETEVFGKKASDSVKIEMPDGQTLKGRVEYVSAPEDGYCVVTVSTDREYASLADIRKIKVRLIFDSYQGFVVPARALHVYNGEYGVFVKKSSKTAFKKAEVLYSDDEYAVISPLGDTELKLYDAVITDGDLSEYYN